MEKKKEKNYSRSRNRLVPLHTRLLTHGKYIGKNFVHPMRDVCTKKQKPKTMTSNSECNPSNVISFALDCLINAG